MVCLMFVVMRPSTCLAFLMCLGLSCQWVNDDEKLKFTREWYVVTLKEDPKGSTLAIPENSRMGIELPRNWRWKLSFSIVSGNLQKSFKVESKVVGDFNFLRIKTRPGSYINRESGDKFELLIQATVRQSKKHKEQPADTLPQVNTSTIVVVNILDENDLAPLFSSNLYSIEVPETTPVYSSVFKASATDADLGFNAEIIYGFLNAEASKHFSIHPMSGVITLVKELDFRDNSKFELGIFARNRGFKKKDSDKINYAKVRILVVEANRFSPEISIKNLFPCARRRGSGTVCALFDVTDKDSDVNGFIDRVEVVNEFAKKYFRILPRSGGQTGEYALEMFKEANSTVQALEVMIQAVDSGRPPKRSSLTIPLEFSNKILADDFQASIFLEISECLPVKTPFPLFRRDYLSVLTQDLQFFLADNGVISKYFSISRHTGVLYLEKELDFEVMSDPFNLTFNVIKSPLSKPPTSASSTSRFHQSILLTNVTIKIQDCNDHDPSFHQASDEIIVEANASVDAVVYKMNAVDPDAGGNGSINYYLIDDNNPPFSINSITGSVHLNRPLDPRKDGVVQSLTMKASDLGFPYRRESHFVLKILLKGVRCIAPMNSTFLDDGTSALNFPLIGKNLLGILAGNDDSCFYMDAHSSALRTSCSFDEQRQQRILSIGNDDGPFYEVVVTFSKDTYANSDAECLRLFGQSEKVNANESEFKSDSLASKLCDKNLNAPRFPSNQFFEFTIVEDTAVGSEISQIEAEDADCGYNGLLKFVITSGNMNDHFKINPFTGALTVMRELDYETVPRFVLNVTACDSGLPSYCQWKEYVVFIVDVNDNAPKFVNCSSEDPTSYQVSVLESAVLDSTVLTVSAEDVDSDSNGRVEYELLNTEFFEIDRHTGDISLKKSLDRETSSEMNFLVVASDCGIESQHSSIAKVVVTVQDVNDNIPYMKPFPMTVFEDLPIGSTVGAVYASDPDSGMSGLVSYHLKDGSDGKFLVDPSTGIVTLLSELDYVAKKRYTLTMDVKDHGQPPLASSSELIIDVLPCQTNQNAPLFKDVALRSKVKENQPSGTVVVQVVASDADRSNYRSHFWDFDVSYAITGGSGLSKFSIDKLGIIRTLVSLDREDMDSYWLTVTATDSGEPQKSSKVEVFVKVTDVNDNAPQTEEMIYRVEVPENTPEGTTVIILKIVDPDNDDDDDDGVRSDDDDDYSSNKSGDNDDNGRRSNKLDVTMKITSGNSQGLFQINSVTGAITTTRRLLDREEQAEHLLEISITDGLNQSLTSKTYVTVVVTDVNDNTPTFAYEQQLQRPQIDIPSSLDFLQRLIPANRNSNNNYNINNHNNNNNNNSNNGNNYNYHDLRRFDAINLSVSAAYRHASLTGVNGIVIENPGFVRAFASDGDEGLNGKLIYELESTNSRDVLETFRIESQSGMILPSVNWIQPGRRFDVKVKVSDHGIPSLSSTCIVTMVSVPVPPPSREAGSNNHPRFNDDVVNSSHVVLERDKVGSIVLVAGATDRDGDVLWYFIADGNKDGIFSMNIENGCLVVASRIDRKLNSNYDVSLLVTDGWHYDVTTVHIKVFSSSDNSPHFSSPQSLHFSNVSELIPPGSSLGRVEGFDFSGDQRLLFSISGARNPLSLDAFIINPQAGEITTQRELDFEKLSSHLLLVSVRDQGVPFKKGLTQILITLLDENDNRPKFYPSDSYSAVLRSPSLFKGGDWVAKVQAADDDEGLNGELFYAIVSGNKDHLFEIDQRSGLITINRSFNPTQSSRVVHSANRTLRIRAQDHGTPPLSSFATLSVTLASRHEEPPGFERELFEFEVRENQPPGQFVGSVRVATHSGELLYILEDKQSNTDHVLDDLLPRSNIDPNDPDSDNGICSGLPLTCFQIHPYTGVVTTTRSLDFEKHGSFKFKVKAMGKSDQSAVASVIISVLDANDNEPQLTTFDLFGEVEESADVGKPIRDQETGKPLLIGGHDLDGSPMNSDLSYTIISPIGRIPFELSRFTGLVVVSGPLDREAKSHYILKVQVVDMGNPKLRCARLVSVFISILDVNDNAPEFLKSNYLVEIPFPLLPSLELLTVSAVDLDDTSVIVYSFVFPDSDKKMTTSKMDKGIPAHGFLSNDEQQLQRFFQVDQSTGVVTVCGDVEALSVVNSNRSWRLAIKASDSEFETVASLEVRLQDSALSSSSSSSSSSGMKCKTSDGKVTENLNETQLVGAFDGVRGNLGNDWSAVSYELLNYRHLFQVQRTSGVVYTRPGVVLDREGKSSYLLSAKVTLKDKLQLTPNATTTTTTTTTTCSLNVTVADDNDNSPVFVSDGGNYALVLAGNGTFEGARLKVTATDRDVGDNGLVHYEIVGGDGMEHFQIDPISGDVTLTRGAEQLLATIGMRDQRKAGGIKLVVKASDNGHPPLSTTTRINILVAHSNAPHFETAHYIFDVPNNASRRTVVGVVRNANHTTGQVIYELFDDDDDDPEGMGLVGGGWKDGRKKKRKGRGSERFGLEFRPTSTIPTGSFCSIVILSPLFDRGDPNDDTDKYDFTIRALDVPSGLTALTRVTVNVLDVKRTIIKFVLSHYETTVQSSAPHGTTILTARAFGIESPDPHIRYHLVDYSECGEVLVNEQQHSNDYNNTNVQHHANNDYFNNSNTLDHGNDDDVIVSFKMGFLTISEETGTVTVKTPLYLLNPQKNQEDQESRRDQQQQRESKIPHQQPVGMIQLKQCIKAFHPSYPHTRFDHAMVTLNIRRMTESKLPTFERKIFEATVDCDAPSKMFVKDLSIGSPMSLTHALRKVSERGITDEVGLMDNILVINPKTGIVSIRSSVSLKKFCSLTLPLKTVDQSESRASYVPANQRSPELVYNVSISDGMGVSFSEFRLRAKGVNHHAPIFERVFYSIKVNTDIPHMTELVRVHARDEDEDLYYGGVEFKITKVIGLSDLLTKDDASHWFTIDGQKGTIYNKKSPLQSGLYHLTIMAEDGGGKHSRALVEILVLPTPEPEDLTRFTMEEAADFGGNAFGALMMPFYLGEFIVTVSEAAGVGGVAVQVLEDKALEILSSKSSSSSGKTFCGVYSMKECTVGDLCGEYFKVDASFGSVIIRKPLGDLAGQLLSFALEFMDCNNTTHIASVKILVTPSPVQPPEFERSSYLFFVDEDKPLDWVVATMRAMYPESLRYILVPPYDYKQLSSDLRLKGQSKRKRDLVRDDLIGYAGDQSTNKIRDGRLKNRALLKAHSTLLVDSESGVIKISGEGLDRERSDTQEIFIKAQSANDPRLVSKVIKVTIKVMDVNDNDPRFDSDSYTAMVSENMPPGTTVAKVMATDPDLGSNGDLTYFLLSNEDFKELNESLSRGQKISFQSESKGRVTVPFVIDEKSGWLRTLESLDREAEDRYEFVVVAEDSGVQKRFSWTSVEVLIDDVNDNWPRFERKEFEVSIREDTPPSESPLLHLLTYDPDPDSDLTFGITSGNVGGAFVVNGSGHLLLRGRLDREIRDSYRLEVVVSDGKHMATSHVVIDVADVNDNPPTCVQLSTVVVPENIPIGKELTRFVAREADDKRTKNSEVFYSLVGGDSELFWINSTTGVISSATHLDREKREMHEIVVKAADGGGRSCQSVVYFVLEDVNDMTPTFNKEGYSVSVTENNLFPRVIGQVVAIDNDLGENGLVRYSLVKVSNQGEGLFSVHVGSGSVILHASLDREKHDSYVLEVAAHDMGSPPLSSTVEFLVNVNNVNDNPPSFIQSIYRLPIPEHSPVGSEVGRVRALRDDSSADDEGIKYSLLCNDPVSSADQDCRYFYINGKSGVITLLHELDFETVRSLSLVVLATDDDNTSLSSSASVLVDVRDINDNAPTFQSSVFLFNVEEDVPVGGVVGKVEATDYDSEKNSLLNYVMLNGTETFAINNLTGEIQTKHQLDREEWGEYKFTVLAIDGGEPQLTGSAEVIVTVTDVNDSPPTVVNEERHVNLREDVEIGHEVVTLMVIDDDLDPNAGPFTFELTSLNSQQHEFMVDMHGKIRTASKLDSKIKDKYSLLVLIYDNGYPPLSTEVCVNITVLPRSDAPLRVLPLEISIWITEQDETFVGGIIGQVKVTGSDSRLLYFLQDGGRRFGVDPNDGTVKTLDELNQGTYNLTVSVSDGRFVSQSSIHITVTTITTEVLKNSLMMRVIVAGGGDLPDLFALRESIANVIGVDRREVMLIGAQETREPTNEASAVLDMTNHSRNLKRETGRRKYFELLLAVKKLLGEGYFKNSVLKRRLEQHREDIELRSKLRILQILANPCSRNACPRDRDCHPDIQLDTDRSVVMATDGMGVVSYTFRLTHQCLCKKGMAGPSCEEVAPDSRTSKQLSTSASSVSPPTRSSCFGDGCHDNKVMTFSGKSFASWHLSVAMEKRLSLKLWVRTRQKKARIMHAVGRVDYSILEVDNGRIQFRFDCGGGPGMARVDGITISDGQWHAISVERIDRDVRVAVDYIYSGEGRVPGVNDILNLDSDLVYFGGEVTKPNEEVRQGFVGCLKDVEFDSVPLSVHSSTGVGKLQKMRAVETGCIEEYFVKGQCSGQCLNGGTCISLSGGSFECRCQPRFSGVRCEVDERPCISNPCLNGGTCTNHRDKYNCSCLPNFKGRRCESSRYQCACKNGGTCLGDDDLPCQCTSGYKGPLCDEDVDECLTHPCPHLSRCINLLGSYTCNCSGGLLSRTCDNTGDHQGYLPPWRITSEEVFIITAILASLLLISLFMVLACKCCFGKQKDKPSDKRRGTNGRPTSQFATRDHHEIRPLRSKNSKVFFYSPKLSYDPERPLTLMNSSQQTFPYGASSTSASSGSFNYSNAGEFRTFQDPGTPPSIPSHHHYHHRPPPVPQRPSYFPLNNRRQLPTSLEIKASEPDKTKEVEPKMAVIGELENLLAKGCADRNVSVLKSTAAAIQNRIVDSKRNDLALISSGKSPDRGSRPVDFYRLSFDSNNVVRCQQQHHQQPAGYQPKQSTNSSRLNYGLDPCREVASQSDEYMDHKPNVDQQTDGVQTKFIQNNYAITCSPDKQLKFPGNVHQTGQQQKHQPSQPLTQQKQKSFTNNNLNVVRPYRVEDLYSVPDKQRNKNLEAVTPAGHAPSYSQANQQQHDLMSGQPQQQDLASRQHQQQLKLLQQAQQLPQHVGQHLRMFPQKNLPVIHSKAVMKHEGVERKSSRVKLEQLSNRRREKSRQKKENATKQQQQQQHQDKDPRDLRLQDRMPPKLQDNLASGPTPEVPARPLKNVNCLKQTNVRQLERTEEEPETVPCSVATDDDIKDDCSWKGEESEYVGESDDDEEDDDEEDTDGVHEMELLIPSWSPEDYSFKPTTSTADNNKTVNNNTLQQQDLLNNNDDDGDINDSSIDGILSNAVGNDSRNSFDDSTINKFLQDTLQLFRRKKEPSVVDSSGGLSSLDEKTGLKTEKTGPRIFGKTGSFRNVFGDRRASREMSVESEGGKVAAVARKLSFGSRNFEARNWLREKLFGKVSSCSEVNNRNNTGDNPPNNNNNNNIISSSRDSNLLSAGRFTSNDLSMSSVRSSSSIDDRIPDLMSASCLSYQSSSNYDNCFSDGGVSHLDHLDAPLECPQSSTLGLEMEGQDSTLEGKFPDDNLGLDHHHGDGGIDGGCGGGFLRVKKSNLEHQEGTEGSPSKVPKSNRCHEHRKALVFDSDDSVNFIDDGDDDDDDDGGGDDDGGVDGGRK